MTLYTVSAYSADNLIGVYVICSTLEKAIAEADKYKAAQPAHRYRVHQRRLDGGLMDYPKTAVYSV